MAIQGLAEYGGFYNQYCVNDIPQVSVETVQQQNEQQQINEQEPQSLQNDYTAPSQIEDNRSRIANLEDVSLTFNKEDTFDYIGSESEIGNLDIQQAVSDMKKDQALQEYQFFVGSNIDQVLNDSPDGRVLQKLNF